MDTRKLTEILRATIDPNQRQHAEEQLSQIHKIIGFAPSLLQVVVADADMPVRQAGVIYLKNMVSANWADREAENGHLPFSIHEQDRAMIRDTIVDAVIHAPEIIRSQLALCVHTIVRNDFPARWTQIVDKVSIYLQNPDVTGWSGALLCLHQLVKNYEYRKKEDRGPLNEAMNLLLPMMYQLCVRLLPDPSEQSVLLQKQIFKIFFTLTQYHLSLELIPKEVFAQWMEVFRTVADRPVPEETNAVEEEDRLDLPWWKCKKWALHILHRMFERYGSPGNVMKEYKEFSVWYLKTFSAGIIEVLLRILDQYRQKIYVSPRVLQHTLNYLNNGVCHAISWNLIKPHMLSIIQDVLFPMMCYTEGDDELWTSDPYEYIRIKFDVFEDFSSPTNAAQSLLSVACEKRKHMLTKTMQLALQILNSNADPHQKDGALHMIGSVSSMLLKKKIYKNQLDGMIVNYVFPEFASPHGHMRARACWVLQHFSDLKFRDEHTLAEATRRAINALLNDSEMPVKVEAALIIESFLNRQPRVRKYIEPRVKPIALELLNIIRETENDDLTTVMQRIVCAFTEQLIPVAVEICTQLAGIFSQVLETDEGTDEKAITAMGVLSTLESVVSVTEDYPEINLQIQPMILNVVVHIFTNFITEFYDEALSLVYNLTSKTIMPDLWRVLELIYQIFDRNGAEFFQDMMPCLHNYVTVGTEQFLSNENYLLAMFQMCKAVLPSRQSSGRRYGVSFWLKMMITNADIGEEAESCAAKLLEVIILQCKGRVDQCIPSFVEVTLKRLTEEVKTSELRTMCLQVVIAAVYYNPQLLLETLDKLQMTMPGTESITSHFVKQWLHDADCFLGLHDRKVCVLGLCALISVNGSSRPVALNECAAQVIPALLLLFDGLRRAYAARAQDDGDDDDDDDDVSTSDGGELSSDEDALDEDEDFLENLEEQADDLLEDLKNAKVSSEETLLEIYKTPLDEENCEIDEYIIFKEVLQNIQAADPGWYQMLTAALTTEQQTALQEVLVLADQRKAAAESKKIEQSGGYVFNQQTVPTSFKFGGGPLNR